MKKKRISFPNISNHNNVIEWVLINTQEVKQIIIPKGSYGIMELIKEIKREFASCKNNLVWAM